MLTDKYWGLFAQSGNIDVYLAYKRAAQRETEAPDVVPTDGIETKR